MVSVRYHQTLPWAPDSQRMCKFSSLWQLPMCVSHYWIIWSRLLNQQVACAQVGKVATIDDDDDDDDRAASSLCHISLCSSGSLDSATWVTLHASSLLEFDQIDLVARRNYWSKQYYYYCKPLDLKVEFSSVGGYDGGDPAVSYRWTGWVWGISGRSSSRLQENYASF